MATFFHLIGQLPVSHKLPASDWLKVLSRGGYIYHAFSGAGLLGPVGKLRKGEYLSLNDLVLRKLRLGSTLCWAALCVGGTIRTGRVRFGLYGLTKFLIVPQKTKAKLAC